MLWTITKRVFLNLALQPNSKSHKAFHFLVFSNVGSFTSQSAVYAFPREILLTRSERERRWRIIYCLCSAASDNFHFLWIPRYLIALKAVHDAKTMQSFPCWVAICGLLCIWSETRLGEPIYFIVDCRRRSAKLNDHSFAWNCWQCLGKLMASCYRLSALNFIPLAKTIRNWSICLNHMERLDMKVKIMSYTKIHTLGALQNYVNSLSCKLCLSTLHHVWGLNNIWAKVN